MKKKLFSFIIFMLVFYVSNIYFLYVEAAWKQQPEICNWPSKTMSLYFDFQSEAIDILLWSKVNSMRYSASFGNWGLFTNEILTLKWTTAIDLIASSIVWNAKAFVSNSITSVILLALTSQSVIQSNLEWFAILFADRPIVRDYKTTLDIETELFNVAYFRSKEIDLTQSFKSDLLDKLYELIKKYQKLWLLENWNSIKKSESMADILLDLVAMNTAMKHFISVWWNLWTSALQNYNWCLWNYNNCTRDLSIIKFSNTAIENLYKDYKDVRAFGECNSYASFFKSNINNAIKNNKETTKSAINDINNAAKRLKWALIWNRNWESPKNRCNISDYEMAQLQAYRWWNFKCTNSLINSNISSALLETKKYFNDKKAQRWQKEKTETILKKSTKPTSKNIIMWDIPSILANKNTTSEKKQIRYKIYWENTSYNPNFSIELNSDFLEDFWYIIDQYWQSQENAITSDLSDLFPKWKWLLDQIDTTIKNTNILEWNLQDIEDIQCSMN